LNKIGHKNIEVSINSIGDKDSVVDFERKLAVFIKKNFNAFPNDLRQAVKKNHLAILTEFREEWKSWYEECPKSIDFLSENSRQHFKEVIEFLEIMEIPYRINHSIFSDLDIGSETVYSISSQPEQGEDSELLAFGFRYNRLAKKIGLKKDVGCACINISAKLKKPAKKIKSRGHKPAFYLVQFGSEAKLRSFIILRELFKAGVTVNHAIAKDKLSSQIGVAESSDAAYIILIGQKEALDNSVAIRNSSTRAQEIVAIAELAERIKEIVKG